jgi:tetratricopeptide (TPR) repeat protein
VKTVGTSSPERARLEDIVHPALLLLLLLAIVAACHAPALGGPFMWDDRFLIVDAPRVIELRPLGEYFVNPFWSGGGAANASAAYFRPLVVLSFALDHSLWSGNPTGFHVTNLLLHLLNTTLVYVWVRRRTQGPLAAIAIAALFGLHPRLTEAVSWISGRTDLLASSFVLLGLVTWKQESLVRRCAAAALLVPALLCKEVALAGAIALGVQEWLAAGAGAPPVARLRRLLPVTLAVFVYGMTRIALFPVKLSSLELGFARRAGAVLEALGRYAFSILNPWQPRALQGALGARDLVFVVVGALVLLALAAFLFVELRRPPSRRRVTREDAPALALFGASLALVLHAIPIPVVTIAADRFLYLPLVGLAAFLAPRLERIGARLGVVRLAVLAALLSFGFVTVRRASLWSDELAFWMEEQRHGPSGLYQASVELGNAFARAGLHREAYELASRAIRGPDGHSRVVPLYNSAVALGKLGRTAEAKERYQACLARSPSDSYCRKGLVLLALQNFEFAAARSGLEDLVRRGEATPTDRKLLLDLPKIERAKAQLEDAAFRNSPAGLLLDAQLRLRVGRLDEALPLWERVLETQGQAQAMQALRHLLALGSLEQMNRGVARFQARFGAIPDDFANAYVVRRTDIEAALRAKQELGI